MSWSRLLRGVRPAGQPVLLGGPGAEAPAEAPHGGPSREELEAQRREAAEAAERQRLHEATRQQGYAQGLAQAQAETQAELERLAGLVRGALSAYDEAVRATEDQLVELALAIAEKLARTGLQVDADALHALVRTALQHVGRTASAVIRAHPDDCRRLEPFEDELRRLLAPDVRFTIAEDPDIASGSGCVIRTGAGEVDARIETQLEEVAAELLSRSSHAARD